MLSVSLTDIEAGDRPNRHVVNRPESRPSIEPFQRAPGCKLTPAHSEVVLKCEQARGRPLLYDAVKCNPVGMARSFAIGTADPPIHAPAAAASALFAEQILKVRPKIRR